MPFHVQLTLDAARDLEDICAPGRADRVLERIEDALHGLSEFPERGSQPRELLEIGIREYRQVIFKTYRIIYRITGQDVVVLLIADGRRDMSTLLERRLTETWTGLPTPPTGRGQGPDEGERG